TADRVTFEAARFDQSRGVIAGGIAEHRARVGLAERLRGNAPGEQRFNLEARLRAVAARQPDARGDEPFLVCAVCPHHAAVTDAVLRRRALVQPARAVYRGDALHDVPCLAAVAP